MAKEGMPWERVPEFPARVTDLSGAVIVGALG
jgi:hypothetical protein